ncbi:ATP-binding protein [Bradyrhizobium sp.]|uniref:ATP-binding protein n=1 Tax=Bradyrhizobium sp. TaxID=376 RepID=UPI0025BAD920|nr:ATP-binding protein [Bradyrhizobium sp.]
MKSRAREKWRPSLGLVISVAFASVAMLPLVGLFFFRLYDNQLIHQTEAELVAQGRVLAAVYARDVEARLGNGIALGAEIRPESRPDHEDQMTPIRPALDLAADGDLLRRRPNALPATTPASPTYVEIGTKLMPIVLETQKVTLAGFRILDPRGVVIAGRDEVGQSLAHIEEVATALQGEYRAVLRTRKPDKPPPPIYSVSRGVGVHVFSAMPVIVGNRVAGVVYTSRTPSNIFAHLYQERGKFILAGLAVVLATVIIGLIFSRTITRPMHELVDRAARIGRGDRNAFQPLAHYGTREFAQLSHSFLDMAEQLSRRSDYIATFSAHLTHELKSPLTSIKGAAELLLDSLQGPSDNLSRMEQKNFVSNILSDTGRLEVMTQRLRELARAEAAPLNEHTELSDVIGGLKSRFPTRAIEEAGALDRSIGMSGEKALIVLSHLTDNAIRHNAKRVRLEAVEENSTIKVTVSNDGDPISESNREKIFDAFFTTRRDTGGTGMGLAIAQAVMTSHGGSIRLLSSKQGVAFELRFPVV